MSMTCPTPRNAYPLNEAVQLSVVFTTESDGLPVDADEVELFVRLPSGATEFYLLSNGGVTRTGVGAYRRSVTPAYAGTWAYRWVATGNIAASTGDRFFDVNSSLFG